VFVAGILVGDLRAPYKAEIERFHSSLASLAEIVAFTMLGLIVSIAGLARTATVGWPYCWRWSCGRCWSDCCRAAPPEAHVPPIMADT
jgi:hypothetical protein